MIDQRVLDNDFMETYEIAPTTYEEEKTRNYLLIELIKLKEKSGCEFTHEQNEYINSIFSYILEEAVNKIQKRGSYYESRVIGLIKKMVKYKTEIKNKSYKPINI